MAFLFDLYQQMTSLLGVEKVKKVKKGQNAGLVLPGPKLDGASLQSLMEAEGVSFTAAVPTVWLGLLQHLEATGGELSTLKRVVIGG
ncbi:MAG: hypothetical protein B7Z05_08400, partial [Thiotrichales bacterium 32-46-8]